MNHRKYNDHLIEAVITCVNYHDFLTETLPFNLPHVDRLVVVTAHDDHATREICRRWSVECVLTDAFTEKSDEFNKGYGINVGLGALRQHGWILHLDADIVLPITFRNMLAKSSLQRHCIYGAERANVTGWKQWQRIKHHIHNSPQFSYRFMVDTPADTPVGANVIHKQHGYAPIGFFQLWHSEYAHQYELRYPETHGSAEHADVQWAIRWPRRHRILLPTVRVFHLTSEIAPMGANWNGRKTQPFTQDISNWGAQQPATPSKYSL